MKTEVEQIQRFTEITVSDNPTELTIRIAELAVYHSRTGFLLAEAKKALNRRKTSEIQNTILKIAKENCLSASVQNALLTSICEEEQFMVDWLDRLNSTCKHQLDAVRSLLSYEKENMRINKTGY